MAGFIDGLMQTTVGNNGSNNILGFVDNQRSRQSNERMFQQDVGLRRDALDKNYETTLLGLANDRSDIESIGRLRTAQEGQINATTAGLNEGNFQNRVSFDASYGAQGYSVVMPEILQALKRRGIDPNAASIDQMMEVVGGDTNIRSLITEIGGTNPAYVRGMERVTGASPGSVQMNRADGGDNLVASLQNGETGQPGMFTERAEPAANNPTNRPASISPEDLFVSMMKDNAIAGGQTLAQFQGLVGEVPDSVDDRINAQRGNVYTPTSSPVQGFNANAMQRAGASGATVDSVSGNVGLTDTSGGFQREAAVRADESAIRINEASASTQNQIALGDAGVRQSNDRATNEQVLSLAVRSILEPDADATLADNAETRLQNQQTDWITESIMTQTANIPMGQVGFFDGTFEKSRQNADPSANRQGLVEDMAATLSDPTQLQKLIDDPTLGFPAQRKDWSQEDFQRASQIGLLSRRLDLDNNGFAVLLGVQPPDIDSRGKITAQGIEAFKKRVTPGQRRGLTEGFARGRNQHLEN